MLQKSHRVAEELNTLTNAEGENNSNSSKLVEMEDMDGTPFKLVKTENGCFIGYGNNRLTEFGTEVEMRKLVEEKSWEFLGTFIISVITSFNNYQNQNK